MQNGGLTRADGVRLAEIGQMLLLALMLVLQRHISTADGAS